MYVYYCYARLSFSFPILCLHQDWDMAFNSQQNDVEHGSEAMIRSDSPLVAGLAVEQTPWDASQQILH